MKRYHDRMDELPTSMHEERLTAVVEALRESRAQSVLDLGCGSGELLLRLTREDQFSTVAGVDTSQEALAGARALLAANDIAPSKSVSLQCGSFTTFIEDLAAFDAAVLLETIEHIPPNRLSAVEKTVFAGYRPKTVLITTPNFEYNILHGIPEGAFRHDDHQFEWSREKFRKWAAGVADRHGFRVDFIDIGPVDAELGSSTQMAVFSRRTDAGRAPS